MSRAPRRSLPLNPYASRPVSDWLQILFSPGTLADRYRAWSAVTSLGPSPETWPQLLETLNDAEPELRAATAHWIAIVVARHQLALDDSTARNLQERLSPLLTDADPDVRLASAEACVALAVKTPEVAAVVLSLLRDPETETTSLAVLARLAGQLATAAIETVPLLAKLLSAESGEVREAAALSLAALGTHTEDHAAELTAALEDEEPIVREAAAGALGQHRQFSEATRRALQAASTDEDAGVAAAALQALTRIT